MSERSGLTGYQILNDPILNKGTAFTEAERDLWHLHGLLPPSVAHLEEQVARRYKAFRAQHSDLDKYIFLRSLQDTNETLFYALLVSHLEEMMPVVYTPTVGLGCQRFSEIFRKPRGLFLSIPHKDRIRQILSHPRYDGIEVIVVTDGERILGLGDQGAGGMGIPIGKLSLYTGCGGIHPRATLPIMLDVGTDNAQCLADPLYIGWHHARVGGAEYDSFIEEFVSAVHERWPHVLLQWEDFAKANATRMLDRYRDRLCTFNDDIQGTAAVATGAVLSAMSVTGISMAEQRIAVLGAGSAGCGISDLLLKTMIAQGVPPETARRQFYLIDRDGLLLEGMNGLASFQQPFTQPRAAIADWQRTQDGQIGLFEVMANAKPTVLIGVSGQPGAFSEAAIREMARHVDRPAIFPLSNPTSRAEADPADLLAWTHGRAVVGTGSPFAPIERAGKPFKFDQTNNSYIFPGVGLGAIAVKARRVTDGMFMAAARVLADLSPAKHDPHANLLPPVSALRETARQVAVAVAAQAISEGLSDMPADTDLDALIDARMWRPVYSTTV
jgi:malate dehydrogenase (oxaloacetate-decarboxylating)